MLFILISSIFLRGFFFFFKKGHTKSQSRTGLHIGIRERASVGLTFSLMSMSMDDDGDAEIEVVVEAVWIVMLLMIKKWF